MWTIHADFLKCVILLQVNHTKRCNFKLFACKWHYTVKNISPMLKCRLFTQLNFLKCIVLLHVNHTCSKTLHTAVQCTLQCSVLLHVWFTCIKTMHFKKFTCVKSVHFNIGEMFLTVQCQLQANSLKLQRFVWFTCSKTSHFKKFSCVKSVHFNIGEMFLTV